MIISTYKSVFFVCFCSFLVVMQGTVWSNGVMAQKIFIGGSLVHHFMINSADTIVNKNVLTMSLNVCICVYTCILYMK